MLTKSFRRWVPAPNFFLQKKPSVLYLYKCIDTIECNLYSACRGHNHALFLNGVMNIGSVSLVTSLRFLERLRTSEVDFVWTCDWPTRLSGSSRQIARVPTHSAGSLNITLICNSRFQATEIWRNLNLIYNFPSISRHISGDDRLRFVSS